MLVTGCVVNACEMLTLDQVVPTHQLSEYPNMLMISFLLSFWPSNPNNFHKNRLDYFKIMFCLPCYQTTVVSSHMLEKNGKREFEEESMP